MQKATKAQTERKRDRIIIRTNLIQRPKIKLNNREFISLLGAGREKGEGFIRLNAESKWWDHSVPK